MSEREKLEQYIATVQRAVMAAPDERTRMVRLFVLALAQGELAFYPLPTPLRVRQGRGEGAGCSPLRVKAAM